MMLEYKGKKPKIGENVFIAPNATIIGDVSIGEGSSVWFGAVLRGDLAPITVGKNTNIQDNCTVHTDENKPTTIGDYVTIGHNAVLHGCTLEDRTLIGINACILNDARIRTASVVAAGSVVKENQEIGPFQLAAGSPAQVKKELPKTMEKGLESQAGIYMALRDEYLKI